MRIRFRRTLGATIAALTTTLALVSPARAEFPDQGNRILFVRGRLSPAPMAVPARGSGFEVADLFSMKNNGKDVRRVTETPSTTEFGGWYSPDGEEIVFWGLKGERRRVFRADADGRHVTALTSNQTSVMPNWSGSMRSSGPGAVPVPDCSRASAAGPAGSRSTAASSPGSRPPPTTTCCAVRSAGRFCCG